MSDLPLPSVALGMAPPDPPSLLPSVWLRRIVRHLSFYSLSPAEAVLPAGVVAAATTARGRQDVRAPPLSSSCPFRSSTRTLCDEKSDHDLNVFLSMKDASLIDEIGAIHLNGMFLSFNGLKCVYHNLKAA